MCGKVGKYPSRLWMGGSGRALPGAEKALLLGFLFSKERGVQLGTKNGEV